MLVEMRPLRSVVVSDKVSVKIRGLGRLRARDLRMPSNIAIQYPNSDRQLGLIMAVETSHTGSHSAVGRVDSRASREVEATDTVPYGTCDDAAEVGTRADDTPTRNEVASMDPEPSRIAQAREAAGRWVAATDRGDDASADQSLEELRRAVADAGEARRDLCDQILLLPGAEGLPWAEIIPPSKGLALLYNFSPFQDTGSTVASKRIRQFGESVDVIACSFLHHKKPDPTIERIAAPYVRTRHFLPFTPSWATWVAHSAFAEHAANLASRYMAERGRPYEFLYSRGMWSPSLIGGALVKLRHPEVRWIAEFSDPLSQDVTGVHRGGPTVDNACRKELVSAFENSFGPMSEAEKSVFAIAENMVFALADEIIFTNALQMKTMVDKLHRRDLKDRVLANAKVSHHPSLPREFYEMAPHDPQVSPDRLNVAYFGEFYSSRGLIEVTSAMRALPERLRERVHLHVFTNYVPVGKGGRRPRNFSAKQYEDLVARAVNGVGAEGIEHLVTFHPSLPFLEFLAATDSFDLLVVRDAASGEHHVVNPYLPSKWSDYAGSRAATWAIVEEGSTIASMAPRYASPVNDLGAAREVLWSALEDKFGPLSTDAESGARS
ncbi:hypothetical protein K7G68_02025 [Micrococcus luteus]|uniref:hypothetical protein n=1 Tax=Micrococcus luteus TaxID=1270 RepID=UPI001CA6AF7F|nr:hypothetical protein [Micrococcus luteus]QZY84463.1 hypothetical protein K7G68_02025 [Micrococcus luteus]